MLVTTRKIEGGRYAVFYDGEPTYLIIKKGDPPRFGLRQMWDVVKIVDGLGDFLFEDRGLRQCVATLERILNAKI